MKCNMKSVPDIKNIVIAVLCVALAVSLGFNIAGLFGGSNEASLLSLSLSPGTPSQFTLPAGETHTGWISVEGTEDFDAKAFEYISSDSSVATIEYDRTDSAKYVYYNITAKSEGSAELYIRDGDKAKTQSIMLTVEKETEPADSDNIDTPPVIAQLQSDETGNKAQDTKSEAMTYIFNIKSKKFHFEHCKGVSTMSEKNKQVFVGTREEAINEGYDPCGLCKP